VYYQVCELMLVCAARLAQRWGSPIYTFYGSRPAIEYNKGHHCHGFACLAVGCKQVVRRFLDINDLGSMANLCRHAKACWGNDTIRAVDGAGSPGNAWRGVLQGDPHLRTGDIGPFFKKQGKSKVSYSHHQHTATETQCVPLCSFNSRLS